MSQHDDPSTAPAGSAPPPGAADAGHVLELYKHYVSTAEAVSDRRQQANAFFLTLNTAIVALVSYLQPSAGGSLALGRGLELVPIAGAVICYLWYRVLRSYSDLNRAKFEVINRLEEQLPVRPFRDEWQALGEGEDPRRYRPLGKLERVVPWVFLALHLGLIGVLAWHHFPGPESPAPPALQGEAAPRGEP
jgi:hypothetical protein